MPAVTIDSTQANLVRALRESARAVKTPHWKVYPWTARKQQSVQFAATVRRYAGGPSPWTEAEIEIARKGIREGLSRLQILDLVRSEARPKAQIDSLLAAAVGPGGVSKYSRQGKVIRAQIIRAERKVWTEADLQTLRTGLKDGRSTFELAAILGRSIASVRHKRYRLCY